MDRTIIFTLVLLFLFCSIAWTIPSEGNFLPSFHKSIWGVQFNQILRRDFTKVKGKASTTQYFIKSSFGLTERLFLDGKIGWGNVEFNRENATQIDFPTNFAGGYGLRYLLYEDTRAGLRSIFGFQHISCHPLKTELNGVDYRVIWDEWQGSWLLIKQWPRSAFYFGPQYSTTQLKYKVDTFRRRLKTENCWGAILGVDYKLTKDINFNLETRLFNEWGLNLGVSHQF